MHIKGFILATLFVISLRAQPTLRESYQPNPISGWTNIGGPSADAQTFTALSGYRITKIEVLVQPLAGSNNTITFAIRATEPDGRPTGPDLAIASVGFEVLDGLSGWAPVSLDYILTPGKYALFLRSSSNGYAPKNTLGWAFSLYSPTSYESGEWWGTGDGGKTWVPLFAGDLAFRIWGEDIPASAEERLTVIEEKIHELEHNIEQIMAILDGMK